MGFVMVLSWSRQIFLRFFLDARMENFLRGHVAACAAWGGVARVTLYDNLKSAVLERRGDAIRFHPTLLALAGHYRFEPRPVAVARGNEKGRVERSIRYIRDAFFAGRRFADLDDLNAQAAAWRLGDAAERACPEDASLRVRQAFEREHLLALPATAFACEEVRAVSVGKSPYVSFDLNDYSVPATEVQRTLSVWPATVRCASSTRNASWPPIRAATTAARSSRPGSMCRTWSTPNAPRAHRDTDRLVSAAPACRDLLRQAAERGEPLARMGRAYRKKAHEDVVSRLKSGRPESRQRHAATDGFANQLDSHVESDRHRIWTDKGADHPRTFFEFDQQHGIGRVLLEGRAGRPVHHAERMHLGAAAGGAVFQVLATAFTADRLLVELHMAARRAVLQQQLALLNAAPIDF